MSGIVLSASVRQNLLSLQGTAELLATTQNRLSTGKKVNTALDHPTNYFTARSLDARAGDISNLLDGISNGVQVLQSANNGITSLQKLVDTAKSIAVQALQTTVGYSTKSNVSATISGATALDLRGGTAFSSATAISNTLYSGAAGGTTAASGTNTLGGVAGSLTGTTLTTESGSSISAAVTLLAASTTSTTGLDASHAPADGDVMTVNGKTITFRAGPAPTGASIPAGFYQDDTTASLQFDANGNSIVYMGTTSVPVATVGDVLAAIDVASGVRSAPIDGGTASVNANNPGQTPSSVNGTGQLVLQSSTGSDLSISGKADLLKGLGLTTSTGAGTATVTAARTTSSSTLGALIQPGTQLYVNGRTITFNAGPVPAAASVASGSGVSGNVVNDGAGNSTVYLQGGTIDDILQAVDLASGVRRTVNVAGVATVSTASGETNSTIAGNGTLQLSTGSLQDLAITGSGNVMAALGLTGNTGTATSFVAARDTTPGSLSGKTLTFTSFNGGTPVNITFGDGTNGTVKTLNDLNAVLQANNMLATVDSTGKLTIAAGNDYASSTLGSALSGGVMGGSALSVLSFTVPVAPVIDAQAQATRANLVTEYNNILSQITTTAQDASFNGINLLDGDQLKLVFNETGKSVLSITGVTFSASGLGLAQLTVGTDFIDNAAANRVLNNLRSATSLLQSQASALGSNLSIVQIRQDFSKQLINTLQTGSSNLTLADTNEEAANSQALATRQSIAVSALGLANQAQQSVLQLLQ